MAGKNYQQGYHVGRHLRGVKDKPWSHDDLNVLQLDLFERTVVKIAGESLQLSSEHSSAESKFLFLARKFTNDIKLKIAITAKQ